MPKKQSGKTVTIFLILTVILLVCGTSVSLYLFTKERDKRKSLNEIVKQSGYVESQLQGDLEVAQKRVFILQEKNKEVDEKINSLLDDLELEEGLRQEINKENENLKTALNNEIQAKEDLRTALNKEIDVLEQKVGVTQQLVEVEKAKSEKLANEVKALTDANAEITKELSSIKSRLNDKFVDWAKDQHAKEIESQIAAQSEDDQKAEQVKTQEQAAMESVKDPLPPEQIVPGLKLEGRVLSVDKDTEFLIFNLGREQGMTEGMLMSVFRGDIYMGDVQVSRVQEQMSAADFIPPFSSRKVRKNDLVVAKEEGMN